MPTLPLPPLDEGVPLEHGDLPVSDTTDVQATWAPEMNLVQVAPSRDAIQAGELAMMYEVQRATSYAASQSDRLRATGEYLDEIGSERDIQRQSGELDPSYSARINATPTVVDPNDILAAANAILAPYTSILARYSERNDCFFLAQSTATSWSSHVFGGSFNRAPNFPDRLYADATPAGLQPIPGRRPGGARVFSDPYGRYFELRCPDISPLDASVAAVYDDPFGAMPTTAMQLQGFFLGSGTTLTDRNATFLWSIAATTEDVYNAIVSKVETLRGMSMRWTLLVDPRLTA